MGSDIARQRHSLTMNLGKKTIQDNNLVTVLQKRPRKVRSDETGTARNEDLHKLL